MDRNYFWLNVEQKSSAHKHLNHIYEEPNFTDADLDSQIWNESRREVIDHRLWEVIDIDYGLQIMGFTYYR